jgi:hypothetical protein
MEPVTQFVSVGTVIWSVYGRKCKGERLSSMVSRCETSYTYRLNGEEVIVSVGFITFMSVKERPPTVGYEMLAT